MTTDALREAIRTGRPFKITMADGRTLEVPRAQSLDDFGVGPDLLHRKNRTVISSKSLM